MAILVSSGSGWFIDDIELPIGPSTLEKRIIRKPDLNKVQYGFPNIFNAGPQSFELIITGWIWPEINAVALDELAKGADAEVVQISDPSFIYSGRYAIDRSSVKINGPQFTEFLGVPVQAWQFNITFAQFAEQGDQIDSMDLGLELDELGIGFGSLTPSLGPINPLDFIDWSSISGGLF